MKKVICFLFAAILFAGFSPLSGNNTPTPVDKRTKYEFGQTIYNWASFLNLREEPHPDATVLALLPFGSELKVASSQPDSRSFASELVPDYRPFESENIVYPGRSVDGNWLRVNYEGFDGYVFDGYLSEVRPYRKSSKEKLWQVMENFISKKYPASLSEFLKDEATDRIVTQDESMEYLFSQDDYSSTHEMRLTGVSMDEALMLSTKLFPIQGLKFVSKDEIGLFIENDFNCTLSIEQTEKGSRIILSFWNGGC